MIIEKDLETWDQLLAEIGGLSESLEEKADDLLFRGQSDSVWKLKTTMERDLKTPVSLSRYYRFAHAAKSRLETFVETSWDKVPTPPEYNKWLKEKDTLSFSPLPGYEYLAYLRHHSFPSPFMDWTASLYIAAFFAFNRSADSADSVSIYCYLEYASVGKSRSSDQPAIYVLGPYVKVHRRHVLQQSQYTILCRVR